MRLRTAICGLLAALMAVISSGCVAQAQYDKCQRQNDIVNARLEELKTLAEGYRLEAERWQSRHDSINTLLNGANQKLALLQAALNAKAAELEHMSGLVGSTALPTTLSNALADWARESGSDLVEFDEKTGIVRFKSDLVFASGSDDVQAKAKTQISALSTILNSAAAQGFDILIVGHTDDQPIKFSATKHPTNWHLSAHRAIAVQRVLAGSGLSEQRMSVMGFGEFRPLTPNKPGGTAENRRVDLYIVPAGQLYLGGRSTAPAGAPAAGDIATEPAL